MDKENLELCPHLIAVLVDFLEQKKLPIKQLPDEVGSMLVMVTAASFGPKVQEVERNNLSYMVWMGFQMGFCEMSLLSPSFGLASLKNLKTESKQVLSLLQGIWPESKDMARIYSFALRETLDFVSTKLLLPDLKEMAPDAVKAFIGLGFCFFLTCYDPKRNWKDLVKEGEAELTRARCVWSGLDPDIWASGKVGGRIDINFTIDSMETVRKFMQAMRKKEKALR